MIKRISFSEFVVAFWDSYKGNFTLEAKRALFEYLEEEDEDYEFDMVSLVCTWGEYDSALEVARNYGYTAIKANAEARATEWLQDRTVVIPVENTGRVLVHEF